jgi:predicted DNA-binding transcriptional regulator AlpA
MNQIQEVLETSTLTEAQKRLGVSRGTLWRLIRTYNVPTFPDVLDNRVKRVRTVDIEKIWEEANRVRRGLAA